MAWGELLGNFVNSLTHVQRELALHSLCVCAPEGAQKLSKIRQFVALVGTVARGTTLDGVISTNLGICRETAVDKQRFALCLTFLRSI